ncbi:MAG: gamma-glutamyl-gamma-aminobutyrate hydrolase family protein [Eubacteriales bacterium]|nr:gamma-glutamyl-gamma-aminobutyrate hydrolase family protein [Eubacteriales bacterium]
METVFKTGRPVIGIVEPWAPIENGCFMGAYRTYANYPYVQGILKGNGIPLGLPLVESEEDCMAQASVCDGIILSGGADIDVHLYGEEPRTKQGHFDRKLDLYYIHMIKAARSLGIPILGICRGIQAVNVAFGGTLIQDIPSEVKNAVLHDQDAPPSNPCHFIDIEADSFLGGFMPQRTEVNSFHHQAVAKLGTGLRVTAKSCDGIIEALENTDGSPVIAVQWHPEMMQAGGDPLSEELFRRFVNLCETAR